MNDARNTQGGRDAHPPEWEGVARDPLAAKLEIEYTDLQEPTHAIVGALENGEEISPRDVDELYSQLVNLRAVLRHVERATPGRTPKQPLDEFVDSETLQAYSEATLSLAEERRE